MRIEKLTKGMILKNYKELCEVLEIKVTSSNAKIAQFKELERHCTYHKEGNKFVIDEIFKESKAKIENRGGANNMTYQESIILIVSDLLKNNGTLEGNQVVCYPKNYLYRTVGLVNNNFAIVSKDKSIATANALDLPIQALSSAMDLIHTRAEKTLTSGLNGLKSLGLAVWGYSYSLVEVVDGKEYPNITPSIMEERYILHCERETLVNMGYATTRQVCKCGAWDNFKVEVMKLVQEKYPQYTHYNSAIKLNYNVEDLNKYIDSLDFTLEDFKRHLAEHKQNVNNEFLLTMDKAVTTKNASAKKKAIEGLVKLDKKTNTKVSMTKINIQYNNYYARDEYISDSKKVQSEVIDNKAMPIKFETNETKHKTLAKQWYEANEPTIEQLYQVGFNDYNKDLNQDNIPF